MFSAFCIFFHAAKQTWKTSFRPISWPINSLAGEVVASIASFLWNNSLLSRDIPDLSSRGCPDICIGLGLNVNLRGGYAQQDRVYWLVFHLFFTLILKLESWWTDVLTWHASLRNYLHWNYTGGLFAWNFVLRCNFSHCISINWTTIFLNYHFQSVVVLFLSILWLLTCNSALLLLISLFTQHTFMLEAFVLCLLRCQEDPSSVDAGCDRHPFWLDDGRNDASCDSSSILSWATPGADLLSPWWPPWCNHLPSLRIRFFSPFFSATKSL